MVLLVEKNGRANPHVQGMGIEGQPDLQQHAAFGWGLRHAAGGAQVDRPWRPAPCMLGYATEALDRHAVASDHRLQTKAYAAFCTASRGRIGWRNQASDGRQHPVAADDSAGGEALNGPAVGAIEAASTAQPGCYHLRKARGLHNGQVWRAMATDDQQFPLAHAVPYALNAAASAAFLAAASAVVSRANRLIRSSLALSSTVRPLTPVSMA